MVSWASGRIFLWLWTIIALLVIAGIQQSYDTATASFKKQRKKAIIEYSEPLIPSQTALTFLSLGNKPLVADILWLQTIQYFGGGNIYGNYPALGRILDRVTLLDPKFEYPYEFAQIVLPFMKQAPQAVEIGNRGLAQFPDNGLLTFYLASTYMLNLKDYRQAADLYQKAAEMKNPPAPGAARILAGASLSRIYGSLTDRVVAMEYWKAVYDNAKSDDEKERAKNWYAHMQLIYDLESAALKYKADKDSFPPNLEELEKAGYIPGSPQSPIGRKLVIDPKTGTVEYEHLLNPD